MKFTPDESIQKVAEAYSLDACDFFRRQFNIVLDWTDASIKHVEAVMDIFHREVAKSRPSEDQVAGFAKLFGSYVGEVYRKNHGASWGMIESQSDRFAGMKSHSSDLMFWPWGRARSRLLEGAENNVWHYYRELLGDKASP